MVAGAFDRREYLNASDVSDRDRTLRSIGVRADEVVTVSSETCERHVHITGEDG
jgi:hypothetical protein